MDDIDKLYNIIINLAKEIIKKEQENERNKT